MDSYCVYAKDIFNNDMLIICDPVDEDRYKVESIQDKEGNIAHQDYELMLPVYYSSFEFCGGFKVKKGMIVNKKDIMGII